MDRWDVLRTSPVRIWLPFTTAEQARRVLERMLCIAGLSIELAAALAGLTEMPTSQWEYRPVWQRLPGAAGVGSTWQRARLRSGIRAPEIRILGFVSGVRSVSGCPWSRIAGPADANTAGIPFRRGDAVRRATTSGGDRMYEPRPGFAPWRLGSARGGPLMKSQAS